MLRNKTARQHNFAITPRTDVPRSRFKMTQTRKQAFNASELIPIMCEPILPGDVWEHKETISARLATPIAPLVDDLDLETWYFMVPNRITWDADRWEDFITGISASTIPTISAYDATNGDSIIIGGVLDHFGLLPQAYSGLSVFKFNVLPIWAYFTIFNEWFRDQNLQAEWTWSNAWTHDLTQAITQSGAAWKQECLRVNKRHDMFTSSLPWPQKGAAVPLPLGSTAPVFSNTVGANPINIQYTAGGPNVVGLTATALAAPIQYSAAFAGSGTLFADLSAATASTINAMRLAIVTQQLLELDARGGSRYVENLLAHWGVRSPDYRLQNPEYLGGSKIPITINPVAQTAAYDSEPADAASPVGNLGAEMHGSNSAKTFRYASTEHGYIIGLAAVRSTPTYQQGTRSHWRQSTRLEFYDPILANIGEQAVDMQEIWQPANNIPTNTTWGYQEAWAQYRYTPNEITGHLRSTSATPMDWWHLAEEFATEPQLNNTFITDKTKETLARSLATAPSAQWAAQIIMDIRHDSNVARLMPAYSVPGLKHF